MNVIELFAQGEYEDVVKALKAGADPNTTDDEWDRKPLVVLAARKGRIDILRAIKEHGGHLDARDRYGENAFTASIIAGSIPCIEYLLDEGVDDDASGLALSAAFLKKKLVKWFIEKRGVAVNLHEPIVVSAMDEIPTMSDTPLIGAAACGQTKRERTSATSLCKYLIGKGADVNVHGRFGRTALHYAADSGNLELVQLLIESGASPSLTDDDGQTALSYSKTKDAAIKKLLLKRNPKSAEKPKDFTSLSDAKLQHLCASVAALTVQQLSEPAFSNVFDNLGLNEPTSKEFSYVGGLGGDIYCRAEQCLQEKYALELELVARFNPKGFIQHIDEHLGLGAVAETIRHRDFGESDDDFYNFCDSLLED